MVPVSFICDNHLIQGIVFKRGHWDSAADDFVYDLALLNVETQEVTMLTDDRTEEAMPCFSPDGRYLYYAAYTGGIGCICRMDTVAKTTETIYAEDGVTAYYPVADGERIYFTTWYSADHRCDQILCYDGETFTRLPFNGETYDCSDACPAGAGMIYSSTRYGSYDLYYYDGVRSSRLEGLHTEQNELGADFFPAVTGDVNADGILSIADVILLQKWLLAVPGAALADPDAGDLHADGVLDIFDLALMKRMLL